MRPRHLAYLLLLLPVFILRDYTPSNELKYLSIINDAVDDNSWFAFYNHGEVYADKPPLYFWLMKFARLLTGRHIIWLYGLFSLLPAVGIMAVMDKWMRREGIGHDPLASNLMLGTTVMFLGAAAVIRMDMLMCFFIVLALYSFYKLYTGADTKRERWLLPLWIFLAVFSKGPVGLFVPVLSILVFLAVKWELRSAGRYLVWRQWAVMLGLSALWFGMVYAEGGDEYLNNLLVKQTVGRGVDSFHHKEPLWYYFVHLPWMLAPWIFLYAAAIGIGLKRKLIQGNTQLLFVCVTATTFVMLTAFSSKLQIYMLPVFPFVAYLSSAYLYRLQDNGWVRAGIVVPAALLLAAFPASFFATKFIPMEIENMVPFHIAFFILSAGAATAIYLVVKKASSRAAAVLGFSIMLTLAVASFGLPQINPYLGYSALAEGATETARSERVDDFAYFRYYKLRNMDVYLGRDLTKIDTPAQLDSITRLPGRVMMFMQDVQFKRRPELVEILRDTPAEGTVGGYSWYILGTGRAD